MISNNFSKKSLDSRAIKQKEIYLALQRLAMSVTDINEKDLVGIFNLLQPYTNSQEKIDEVRFSSFNRSQEYLLNSLLRSVIHCH